MPQETLTVSQSINAYLESVRLSRSPNTARTYRNAMQAFAGTLVARDLAPDSLMASASREDWIADFADDLKGYAPASERLYLTAVAGWYEFLAAEQIKPVNMPRLRLLIKRRARRPGQRLPQFPRDAIAAIMEFAMSLATSPAEDEEAHLRALRDRAFLVTLGDTGLRVHEACALRRGDLDWNEGQAILIGKGNRQAVVRFSDRALRCLKDYLRARAALDGGSGRSLSAQPIFARHDRGTGHRVLPISTTTGRAIVRQRAAQALSKAEAEGITPHSFRHYFVTTVLRGSGGNLKLAQELARHRNIAVTQRYAHLSDDDLDRGYRGIFDGE
jgi:integrase/recombinase XerC